MSFCNHLIWLIEGEGRLKRANALRKTFTVSLKSRERKDTAANLQVQKRVDSSLKKKWQTWSKSTGRGIYRGYSCCYCISMVTLSCKRSKKDTSLKW